MSRPAALQDRIVLGHNPFFGVDHLSRERGAAREAKFEASDAIVEMIRYAQSEGVGGLMMSTHPRANLVADTVRGVPELRDSLRLYPLLPYVNKYVRAANEKGLVNVVFDQLKGSTIGQKLSVLTRGGIGFLRKDSTDMLKTLIRMELAPFRDLQMQAVFLHDVLTDLALAFDLRGIFELYIEEIEKRFDSRPAFATKNLPLLAQRFAEYGFERPAVLAHFNKIGFGMNPDRESCERCLREHDIEVMAMGTLASGYIQPADAYSYLGSLDGVGGEPGIDSVVVGVSTPEHGRETFGEIRTHMSGRAHMTGA
ncbi:MAG: hypothetical protein AAF581_07630 [Planctomycetota bacterium]